MSTITAAWIYLLFAGICEIGWAIGLKYTDGLSKFWPVVYTLAAYALSFVLLAQAVKVLPVGTAYAIWVGIGVVGAAVLGVLLFQESAAPARIFFLTLIVIGAVGLKINCE